MPHVFVILLWELRGFLDEIGSDETNRRDIVLEHIG
jgi:hypothetical protein